MSSWRPLAGDAGALPRAAAQPDLLLPVRCPLAIRTSAASSTAASSMSGATTALQGGGGAAPGGLIATALAIAAEAGA